jgi:hypothetical protein
MGTELARTGKKVAGILLGFLMVAAAGHGQSFNIDINSEFSPPQAGGGPPSSVFGAAASQPGLWNAVPAAGMVPTQLRGLDGQLTSVVMSGPSGGVGGGNSFLANTGDYALLLNDGRLVGSDIWTLSGLSSGFYRIYSYVVWPSTLVTSSQVTVSGSITPNPQIVTGPMPGNQFIQGITHSIHEISITSGSFAIQVDQGQQDAFVSGFQIVLVPEPSLVLGLTTGLLFLVRRRTRKST